MAAVRWWVVADLVVPMEVRFAIGALVVLEEVPRGAVARLCREYGISRDTFYRYRAQLEAEGLEGLLPKSRRPHRSPNATPPWVVELVVAKHHELVAQGWDGGARSVRDWLKLAGVEGLPSVRTVHKVLAVHGCVEASPAKRPHSSYRRFEAMSPNGMWQIDATEWRLASEVKVVIVRVIDDHSRKILATLAAGAEDGASAWECMKTALDRHGKPVVVLSDNGSAFSARRRSGGYSEFEARLARIGIYHATCAPYHPQTCGKKERDWQPLKRWLRARPSATDLPALQRLLDGYDVIFNTERPHQGIAGQTPEQRYHATPKAAPSSDRPPPARTHLTRLTACAKGRIDIGDGYRIALGREWARTQLHVLRDDLHVVVFHGQDLVKRLTLDPEHKDTPSGLPRNRRPAKPLPST